jgi:hypothetical protein
MALSNFWLSVRNMCLGYCLQAEEILWLNQNIQQIPSETIMLLLNFQRVKQTWEDSLKTMQVRTAVAIKSYFIILSIFII